MAEHLVHEDGAERNDPDELGDAGTALVVPVPPGWVELRAFEDDAAAEAWFERVLAATRGLDTSTAETLRAGYGPIRRALREVPVDAAGLLLTTVGDVTDPDFGPDDLTVWVFTLTQVVLPGTAELNPMAVVERYLGTGPGSQPIGEDDLTETFRTHDGRDGVAIHSTAAQQRLDPRLLSAAGLGPDAGVVHAAVALGPLPDGSSRMLVSTGLCRGLEERPLMALTQAQLTLGATVRAVGDLDGSRVVLDATARTPSGTVAS